MARTSREGWKRLKGDIKWRKQTKQGVKTLKTRGQAQNHPGPWWTYVHPTKHPYYCCFFLYMVLARVYWSFSLYCSGFSFALQINPFTVKPCRSLVSMVTSLSYLLHQPPTWAFSLPKINKTSKWTLHMSNIGVTNAGIPCTCAGVALLNLSPRVSAARLGFASPLRQSHPLESMSLNNEAPHGRVWVCWLVLTPFSTSRPHKFYFTKTQQGQLKMALQYYCN